jgi:DNA-binding CsgD family transcriptional regulator
MSLPTQLEDDLENVHHIGIESLKPFWGENLTSSFTFNEGEILHKVLERLGKIAFITDLSSERIVAAKGALDAKYGINAKDLIGSFQLFFSHISKDSRPLVFWQIRKQYEFMALLNREQKLRCFVSMSFNAFSIPNRPPCYMICQSTVLGLNEQGQVSTRLNEWCDAKLISTEIKNHIMLFRAPGIADQICCYENLDPETEKSISRAEQAVWHGLVLHDTVEKVSEALFISPNTVESHRKSLFKKIGVSSIKSLIKLYILLGLNT